MESSRVVWTVEKTLTLIERLRNLPSLWNTSHPEHRLRCKKMQDLKTLADEFSVDVYDLDKKIKALKTQFRREHRKATHSLLTGAAFCPWFGYDRLSYLASNDGQSKGDKTGPNESITSHEQKSKPLQMDFDSDDEQISSNLCLSDTEFNEKSQLEGLRREMVEPKTGHPPPKRKRRKSSGHKRLKSYLSTAMEVINSMSEDQNKTETEFDIFGKSVGAQLNSLPKIEAIKLQLKIQQTITEHRLAMELRE